MGIDVTAVCSVSDKAHLILPYHRGARHSGGSAPRRAEDWHHLARNRAGLRRQDRPAGIRVGDLRDASSDGALATAVRENVAARQPDRRQHDMKWLTSWRRSRSAWTRLEPLVDRIRPLFASGDGAGRSRDVRGRARHVARHRSRHVSVRDLIQLTAAARPRSWASGHPIGTVLGVAKAYTTRVGGGPLPTELLGARASGCARRAGIRRIHRRAAPLRMVRRRRGALRRARQRLHALAITKLDVLDGLDELDVCTAYRCGTETLTEMPSDLANWRPASRSTKRCGLDRAHARHHRIRQTTQKRAGLYPSTGRNERASRPRSFRRDRIGNTRSSGKSCSKLATWN
jgi:adenylosuccinate synthase